MAAASASSSSSISSAAFHPKKYDVFISFRGEDTRSNFTSHLRDALLRKQIKAYIDDKLPRGDKILPALYKAIEESHISVIIFSKNYASSKWCLEELVKILECKNKGQDVIPVFYKVDPSHVRKQSGSYKEAFTKHEREFKSNQDKLKKWKASLFEAANLAGMDSRIYRDESKLIQKIVEDVLLKLDHKYPPRELKCPFGINENLAPIESLLRGVQTIGIWGMGGIGKTTIAKWLFDKYSSQYEGSCFLANIREKSGKHGQGLDDLRNKLVSKLLEDDDLNVRTTTAESTFVKRRLCRKRVLIVLDDVSTSKQLEYLVGEFQCFGPGSRIIITTRYKHVLTKGRVDAIHKVEELNFQESLQLFSLNAFNQNHPIIGYEELSRRAIDYAKGMPLALEVLGSFLHSKSENEWESALTKLKRIPNEEIQSVLILSYDGLNYEEREIFLDIACFLKGENKELVISLLDSYDFYAGIGLRTLQDNALITIEGNAIWMHDLIQEMGWAIVRQESIKEPGRRSRLRDPKDVYDVLKNNRGTDAVEGILLDISQIRDLHLSVDTFRKMINLRFLKFYSLLGVTYSSLHLPTGLQLFSDKLRYLEWNGYPSKSLQLNFCPEKLVELLMPNSQVEKLWDGVQDFANLKRINLRGCRWLMELPDFSLASNLEEVDLSNCESLCHVHPSILSLHTLISLNLFACKKLKSLESEIHFRSLRDLNVKGCTSLKEFSVSSEEITELDLIGTRIEMLHSSIGRLSRLKYLWLRGLRLENLPNELSCLRNLQMLDLSNCLGQVSDKQKLHLHFDGLQSLEMLCLKCWSNLSELPDNINVLSSLKWLVLTGSGVECLPASIQQLTGLQYLYVNECNRLRSLPELPQSISHLDAANCTSLERVITSRTSRPLKDAREYVYFQNCLKLDEHAHSSIIEDTFFSIKQTAYEIVLGGRYDDDWNSGSGTRYRFYICLPGSRVPKWFKYKSITEAEASVSIELAPTSYLLGFVFCAVIPPFSSNMFERTFIECKYFWEDGKKLGGGTAEWHGEVARELNSDHVYLWYDPVCCYNIVEGIKEIRGNDQWTTCNSRVSFEFNVKTEKRYVEIGKPRPPHRFVSIKECGVYPIYASEEHYNFINKMELESESGDTTTRCQDGLEASEVGLGIPRSCSWRLILLLVFLIFIVTFKWTNVFFLE